MAAKDPPPTDISRKTKYSTPPTLPSANPRAAALASASCRAKTWDRADMASATWVTTRVTLDEFVEPGCKRTARIEDGKEMDGAGSN
eukprot:5306664-Lingulodinium_polyedra.AAC.1